MAAIVRRLAYALLKYSSFSQAPDWVFTIVETQDAYNSARGNLLNGVGIGSPLILAYAPDNTLDRREVAPFAS